MSADILKTAVAPREAIIRVVAFFDLLEQPLTAYEIWQNLDGRFSLASVYEILRAETAVGADAAPRLGQKNGFYFLVGRGGLIFIRQQRYNYYQRKIKIARRFTRWFALWPFVRVVALANVIGAYNLRDGSDIDFFIVTAAHRLWLSRLYCTGLAKLLNSRPNARTKKDKICLSFYLSQEHLAIQDLRLEGGDPYFDYWRRHLVLLYNKKKAYEGFLAANGIANFPPDFFPLDASSLLVSRPRLPLTALGNFWEAKAKILQLKIMPPVLRAAMNSSDGVVINDQVLKLYQRDRRREYAEKYANKINEIFKNQP